MRVLLDAHMLGLGETGNETYIRGLLQGFAELDADMEIVAAVNDPLAASSMFDNARIRFLPVTNSSLRRLLFDLAGLARRESVDICHCTYVGPVGLPCPLVVTVHDASFRRHPEWFTARDRAVLNVGVTATALWASRVITVSEHARRELCHFYPRLRARLRVTHEAAINREQAQQIDGAGVKRRFGLSTRYFLAVGNMQPRKNVARLVAAFAVLRKAGFEGNLVLVGQFHGRRVAVDQECSRHGVSGSVVLTGYVSDAELEVLYRGATAFVYPSLYEGFGLPVLEAMRAGCPVVCSDVTSIPEVAGAAAIFVDPLDVGAIAGAMNEVLDETRRAELVHLGLERVRAFSWRQTAAGTLSVYREALQAGRHPSKSRLRH